MHASDSPITPLQYEPLSQRRRWRYVAAALAISLIAGGAFGLRAEYNKLETRFWLRRCAEYTAPLGEVAYEEHNVDGLQWSSGIEASGTLADPSGTRHFRLNPRCLRALGDDNVFGSYALVFLGRVRASSDGKEQVVRLGVPLSLPAKGRLFAVRSSHEWIGRFGETEVTPYNGFRPTGTSNGLLVGMFTLPRDFAFANLARRVRFFSGRRDPANPSTFTVDLALDDLRARLRCTLIDESTLHVALEDPEPITASKNE